MLFNSYGFIFVFLPVTCWVFFQFVHRGRHGAAIAWLVAASLLYYGWWNPTYLGLILGSISMNFLVGSVLQRRHARHGSASRWVLALGIAANLALLGYFKYAGFLAVNLNRLFGIDVGLGTIVLPLAISFFTFQQIAYLVDSARGEAEEASWLRYGLFVTFFPQLIAGPIVHHKEMLPQFSRRRLGGWSSENLAVGLTIFFLGLFKKAVLADGTALFASPVFEAAAGGTTVSFFEAWAGTLAYTCQIYFDFSGYSDMAIGLARMFGILLPLNFNSPYKSRSIVEFWRRWHMTLSRFLRDYLYIPLGGNRRGRARRYVNLMVTMLLGGLWHGAGWTFVAWGALHGVFLVVNHLWRGLAESLGFASARSSKAARLAGRCLTFFAVVVAWVFFRAADFASAWSLLRSMFAVQGWGGNVETVIEADRWLSGISLIAAALAVAFFAPNTQQFMARYTPALETYPGEIDAFRAKWQWTTSPRWALLTAGIGLVAVIYVSRASEFIYYQF